MNSPRIGKRCAPPAVFSDRAGRGAGHVRAMIQGSNCRYRIYRYLNIVARLLRWLPRCCTVRSRRSFMVFWSVVMAPLVPIWQYVLYPSRRRLEGPTEGQPACDARFMLQDAAGYPHGSKRLQPPWGAWIGRRDGL